MLPKHTALEHVLRRAMRRAGLVTGYVHKCRRQGCGHQEPAPGREPAPLPEVQLQAVPGRPGPEDPVPPPAPHDGVAAAHEGRRPGGGAADHAAPGPAHHDRGLRAPRAGLPQEGDRPPPLRSRRRRTRARRVIPISAAAGGRRARTSRLSRRVALRSRRCPPTRSATLRLAAPFTTHLLPDPEKAHAPSTRRGTAGKRSRGLTVVGARGFEPPTFRSRTERATRLRHAPWCEKVR